MQTLSTLLASISLDLDVTFFIQLFLFAVAFFLLRSLIFKPMIALFEAREANIDDARTDAKRMEREAKEKATTFDEEMRQVRLQAGTERDRLRQEGVRLERSILDRVRKETQDTMANANDKLASEARSLRSDIESQIPTLAKDMASRVLGREVS